MSESSDHADSESRTPVLDPRILDQIRSKFYRDTGKTNQADLLTHLREKELIAADALPAPSVDPDQIDVDRTVLRSDANFGADDLPPESAAEILDALFAVFQRKTGRKDSADFLVYLQREGLTDDEPSAISDLSTFANDTESNLLEDSDRYEVSDTIGEGGMSDVRMARDRSLRRPVAMKFLKGELRSPLHVTQFKKEAQLTAQLDHPNVTPVYDLAVASDGGISFSMKLIEGKTLAELINEARDAYDNNSLGGPDSAHSLATLLEHFLKVCDAMAYAHSKGVIHCDLKPANIMVGRFHEVYVMDWGLARLLPEAHDGTSRRVDLADEPSVVELGQGLSGTLKYIGAGIFGGGRNCRAIPLK